MAEPKTRPTKASVTKFIDGIADEQRRADCKKISAMMKRLTGEKAVMWGEYIIGFGSMNLPYADGSVLDWPIIAFSPRKQALTLYVITGKEKPELMKRLGKHSTGKVCLYIKRLSDVDFSALEELVTQTVAINRKRYSEAKKQLTK